VKKSFTLVPFEPSRVASRSASLYAVHYDGDTESLPMQFFQRPEIVVHAEERTFLLNLLKGFLTKGCVEYVFRHESKYDDSVSALFRHKQFRKNALRLCCCRFGNSLTILGNGCIKKFTTSHKSQDDPEYQGMLDEMKAVEILLTQRIKDKDITILDDGTLIGDLHFDIA
jgi:hypothetical protein